MDSCWFLTDATKFCLMAVSCKSLMPMLQTQEGTAAWHLTVQEIAAGISTSMSWVQRQLFLIYLCRIKMFHNFIKLFAMDGCICNFTGLCYSPCLVSFSHHCWVGSWQFCRGGDSNTEQPHFTGVWSPVLPSCSDHLAQRRYSVCVQP